MTHRRDFREVSPSALRKENHTQGPDPHGHRNPRYGDTPCGTQGCMCKQKDACLSRMYLSYLTPRETTLRDKVKENVSFLLDSTGSFPTQDLNEPFSFTWPLRGPHAELTCQPWQMSICCEIRVNKKIP